MCVRPRCWYSSHVSQQVVTELEKTHIIESVRQLAVLAMRLDSSAVQPDTILLDTGLDSMSATGFLDELGLLFLPPPKPRATTTAAAEPSTTTAIQENGGAQHSTEVAACELPPSWTIEQLEWYPSPCALTAAMVAHATALGSSSATGAGAPPPPPILCMAAAKDKGVRMSDACVNSIAVATAATTDARGGNYAQGSLHDSRAWKRPMGKGQKHGSGGQRLTKAERQARYAHGSSYPTASAAQQGSVLYAAKHGDLVALQSLVEPLQGRPARYAIVEPLLFFFFSRSLLGLIVRACLRAPYNWLAAAQATSQVGKQVPAVGGVR